MTTNTDPDGTPPVVEGTFDLETATEADLSVADASAGADGDAAN